MVARFGQITRRFSITFRILVLAAVFTATAVTAAAQQSRPAGSDIVDPLRPADTSSPRATLLGFLASMNAAYDNFRRGETGGVDTLRAMGALDFSASPNGHTWSERVRRTIVMKEVLDRIELPPEGAIPGDRSVADSAIAKWTIPETSITIARIDVGPRSGAFLFSAETVEQIDRLFRASRHLPYQPDATEGYFEAYIESDDAALYREMRARLKPVDTFSPRATLDGFLDSVNRAYRLVMEADAALRSTPPTITRDEAREIEAMAHQFLQRAINTLDLSHVPRALHEDVGLEAVIQLKEVLDRLRLPPIDAIPSASVVADARQGGSQVFSRSSGPLWWTYPNSEIEIVEITEGDRQGQFLFSAATIDRASDYYEEVRDLPYRPSDFSGIEAMYLSPDTSPGFFEFYIGTPGHLIPGASYLGQFVDGLPDGFKVIRGGQTLWQWIGIALAILILGAATYVAFRVFHRMADRRELPSKEWLNLPPPILSALLAAGMLRFVDQLNITGDVLATLVSIGQAIIIVLMALAAFVLCKAIAETIVASPKIAEGTIDATLSRIGGRLVGFLIAAWIVVAGVRDVGLDVIPLLAGLGVGGLAVALAAQRAVANFIGSMILFINKPVRVGDFCRYGDQIGTVEAIGLYSTRIRSLERTIVTVPNAEFSEMKLDNFAARDQRLLKTVLQLRYETRPEQMRYILVKLRELLLGHPMVSPDPARVRFVNFGAYSKDVEIFAYVLTADHNEYLGIKEDLLLRMEDIVNDAGSGFAFPSQTAYLSRDTGLDTAKSASAEGEVEKWRADGNLAFPEFSETERERLRDTLDFPPEGSPDHQPRAGRAGSEPKRQTQEVRTAAEYQQPSEELIKKETSRG